MYFTEDQVADLYEGVDEVGEKFRDLRERFVLREFQNPGAREHADRGFSRRLGGLVRCIERVFEILPPDRVDIPEGEETIDH